MLSASSRPTGYRRRGSLDERDDGRAPMRVARRRDDAGRLVERVDDALLGPARARARRARPRSPSIWRAGIELALAVDAHAPAAHDLGGGAARGDAGVGEVGGEPHGATIGPLGPAYPARMDRDRSHDARRRGEPAYRARQVWEWLARGAGSYEEMTNLPAALRDALAEQRAALDARRSSARQRASDGTVKALLRTARGNPGRGGDDALPRRAPLAVPLLAVGLPADLQRSAPPAGCASPAT